MWSWIEYLPTNTPSTRWSIGMDFYQSTFWWADSLSCQKQEEQRSFMARSNANALQSYNFFSNGVWLFGKKRVSLSIFNYHTWIEYDILPFLCAGIFAIIREPCSGAIFFIHLVYKQNTFLKLSQKDLVYRVKTCTFAANFTKINNNSSNAETEI